MFDNLPIGLTRILADFHRNAKNNPIPVSALTEKERRFLSALKAIAGRKDVAFAMSDGKKLPLPPAIRNGKTCYLMPRGHVASEKIMDDVTADSSFAGPALSLVTDGELMPKK